MDKLFQFYKRMLELHIGTKTTDIVFHKASEDFYSTLFDCFHQISEKEQDIKLVNPIDCDVASKEAYDLIEQAKEEIESMIEEKNTPWMDNLLRALVDKLEFDCGTARGFLEEEDDETETSDTKEEYKPGLPPKK